MEVISPASLWKDFDRKQLPLDTTVISRNESGGYRVESLYFTALKTADGFIRVYAKLYTPLHMPSAPVIIYFNDIQKDIEKHSTIMETMGDYSFLKIDYAGKSEDRRRYTMYPKSFEKLNYFQNPSILESVPSEVKNSCWYVWAVMAARAVTLIETEYSHINKIGIIGVGVGGSQAIKACSLDRTVSAGMTIYGCGYIPEETGNNPIEYTGYKAALDSESYGPHICAPLLMQITSNESNGSTEYMNNVFSAITNKNCRLSIVERSNRSISVKQRKNCLYWFDYYLKNIGSIPPSPQLKARSSEGRLYLETVVERGDLSAEVEVFVAHSMAQPAYRNWSKQKLNMISDSECLALVPVYAPQSPLYAFVNVKYDKGISLSCPQITVYPDKLNVRGDEVKQSRLIYDSDMGFDDWIVLNDNGTDEKMKLSMETGPFDIAGIASSTGSVATFKIGEIAYKNFTDCALQVLIYSHSAQEIVFAVTKKGDGRQSSFVEYTCTRKVSPADNWSSLTLAATDFKAQCGVLDSFDSIATFEMRSPKGQALISSVRWV